MNLATFTSILARFGVAIKLSIFITYNAHFPFQADLPSFVWENRNAAYAVFLIENNVERFPVAC